MKSLFKIFLIMGILGSVLWFTAGEYVKNMIGDYGGRESEDISPATAQCSSCSKNGRFQCVE